MSPKVSSKSAPGSWHTNQLPACFDLYKLPSPLESLVDLKLGFPGEEKALYEFNMTEEVMDRDQKKSTLT